MNKSMLTNFGTIIFFGFFFVVFGFFVYSSTQRSIVMKNNDAVVVTFAEIAAMNGENLVTYMDSGVRMESRNTDSQFLIAVKFDFESVNCEEIIRKIKNQANIRLNYLNDTWIEDVTPYSIRKSCEKAEAQIGSVVFQGDLRKNQESVRKLEFESTQG